MRVVLIGGRGSGKTTVGRIISQMLAWPFADTDELIEQRAGMTIAQLLFRHGRPHFRRLESAIIAELVRFDPGVISVGGGAVLYPPNVRSLRWNSYVVYLTAMPQTLRRRILSDPMRNSHRPNAECQTTFEGIKHVIELRDPYYRAAAHTMVDTENLSPDQVAEEVLLGYHQHQQSGTC